MLVDMKDRPSRGAPGGPALRAVIEREGRGAATKWASKLGIKPSHLSDICRGAKYASGSLAFAIEAASGLPAHLFIAPRKRAA